MRDIAGALTFALAVGGMMSLIVWPVVFYFKFAREVEGIKRALVIISFMIAPDEKDPDPDIATEEEKAEMNVILFGRKAA